MISGAGRGEIASQLNISKLTYDSYRKNIRQKLNIKNQADWAHILYVISTYDRIHHKSSRP